MVFQPQLGLGGAATLWGVSLPGWAWLASRSSRGWDPVLAFLAGMSAGAGVVHYTLWPVSWRRGAPVLVEAEGLRAEHMPAYNVILYSWTAAAMAALLLDTPEGARRWAGPGFAVPFLLRGNIRRHFTWVGGQAATNPAWWNRALREASA